MAITDWPEEDRPRERLLAQGTGALSNAELLAIFLRTGVKGRSAVDLARDLLAEFGGLVGLLLSLIHISEPTRPRLVSRMPSSA